MPSLLGRRMAGGPVGEESGSPVADDIGRIWKARMLRFNRSLGFAN
jgi:hypothetical protein